MLWWPVWLVCTVCSLMACVACLHSVRFGGLCGLFCTVRALVACVACLHSVFALVASVAYFALCVLCWPVRGTLHCVCFGGLWLGVALCMVCACAIAFVGLALCVENSLCGLFCDLCGPLHCVYLFCVCVCVAYFALCLRNGLRGWLYDSMACPHVCIHACMFACM